MSNPFDVSLKLFYNVGRLSLRLWFGSGGRVVVAVSQCDRVPVKNDLGLFVCRWCGKSMGRRRKTFCSGECHVGFNWSPWGLDLTWQWFRQLVFARDGGRCRMCGSVIKYAKRHGVFPYVCDHIVPLCKGGVDWWQDVGMCNFQTLCVVCNKRKTRLDLGRSEVDVLSGFERLLVNKGLDGFLGGDCSGVSF